jgi:hypothetical protein
MRLDQMVTYFLPGLHLGLCMTATLWPPLWSVLLIFDFPVSVVAVVLAYRSVSLVTVLYLFGTLWWYAVTWAALAFFDPQPKVDH